MSDRDSTSEQLQRAYDACDRLTLLLGDTSARALALKAQTVELAGQLVEAQAERDQARADADRYRGYWRACSEHRDQLTAGRDRAREEAARLKLDVAALEHARTWQVARSDHTTCAFCRQPIRRGHAVEPVPGNPLLHAHVHCPDRHCEKCEQPIRPGEEHEVQPGTGGLVAHTNCPATPAGTEQGEPQQ